MLSHVPCLLLPVLGGRGPQSWFGSDIDLLLELSQGFPPLCTQGTLLIQDSGFFWDRVKTWTLQVENRPDLCLPLQGLALRVSGLSWSQGSRCRLFPWQAMRVGVEVAGRLQAHGTHSKPACVSRSWRLALTPQDQLRSPALPQPGGLH